LALGLLMAVDGKRLGPSHRDKVTRNPTGLVYRGGPLLPSVQLFNIYWSAAVLEQSKLDAFGASIAKSSFLDWLCEYSTPNQTIGRGKFLGSYNVLSNETLVHQSEISSKVLALIASSAIPAPTKNTLYVTYFDANTTIIDSTNATSCVFGSFCGFHVAVPYTKPPNVYIAIIADCGAGLCGGVSEFDGLTVTASHEIIESITDAIPGVGWYDSINGEIADICEHGFLQYTNPTDGKTYYVETGWSNLAGACVDQMPGLACIPTDLSTSASKSGAMTTGGGMLSVINWVWGDCND